MQIRRFLLFFIIASCILVTAGCSMPNNSHTSYFSYRDSPSHAELEGTLGGIAFSAEVGCDERGEYITFLCPDVLAGITLRRGTDALVLNADGKECYVDKEALAGLLSPLDALFCKEEILRIQKSKTETVLTLEGESTLTLNEDGLPKGYTSPTLRFTVVWWERAAKRS